MGSGWCIWMTLFLRPKRAKERRCSDKIFSPRFFRWLSANVMSLRWDLDLVLVYVEPSHAWTCHCWQLLIFVALNHFFATPFSNHCFLLPYETHLQITIGRYLDGWEHVTENTCETSPTHLHHGFVAKWGTYVSPITNHLETELGLPKILKV